MKNTYLSLLASAFCLGFTSCASFTLTAADVDWEKNTIRVETDPSGIEVRSSQGFVGVTPATIPFKVKPGERIGFTVKKGRYSETHAYARGSMEELLQNR